MRNLIISIVFLIFSVTLFSVTTRVLKETDRFISLEIDLSDTKVTDIEPFSSLSGEGYQFSTLSGAPLLPFLQYNVLIPDKGRIECNYQQSDIQQVQLKNRLKPVESFRKEKDITITDHIVDEDKYQKYRVSFINSGKEDSFRGYSYIPVTIYPFTYSDKNKTLNYPQKIVVNIKINGNFAKNTDKMQDEICRDVFINWNHGQSFSRIKTRYPVNFADFSKSAVWYKFKVNADGVYVLNSSSLNGLPIGDIDLSSFRIFSTGGALVSTLFNNPGPEFKEIPLYIVNNGSQSNFDAEDKVMFYARDRDGFGMNSELGDYLPAFKFTPAGDYHYFNPYSNETTYWITWGGSFSNPPLRVIPENSTSFSQTKNYGLIQTHLESEKIRNSLEFPRTWDWFMQGLTGSTTTDYSYDVQLTDLFVGKQNQIDVMVQSETNFESGSKEHHIELLLNSVSVADSVWKSDRMFKISSVNNHFQNGNNNITIRVKRSYKDNIYLNYLDFLWNKKLKKASETLCFAVPDEDYNLNLKYQFENKTGNNTLVFKVNNFDEVSMITPVFESNSFYFIGNGNSQTKYWVFDQQDLPIVSGIESKQPVDMANDLSSVEYIIVSDEKFADEVNQLKSIYQSQYPGSSIRISWVQDIFNQFSGGNPDARAITKYFQYVFQNNAQPRLKGAVLVGSGTLDWRNYSGLAATKNNMMINQGMQTSNSYTNLESQLSSDLFFGHINQYSKPDIFVGRIPAQTKTELQGYVSKLDYYVNQSKTGEWKNKVLLLADDQYHTSTNDWEHTVYVQSIANALHPAIFKEMLYSAEYDLDEFRKKPQVRDLFIKKINQGALFTVYIGHGSYDGLSDENYMRANDVPSVNEMDNMTVFMAGSCSVSDYDSPYYNSLGDILVRNSNGGAIASIAALRVTWGSSNAPFFTEILKESYNNYKNLGESFLTALARTSGSYGNNHRYNILGDPMLKSTPPQRNNKLLILDDPADTLVTNSYQARQKVYLKGDFENTSFNSSANVMVFDSNKIDSYIFGNYNQPLTRYDRKLYNSNQTLHNGQYESSFVVPVDIYGGQTGRIVTFYVDESNKKEYINCFTPVSFNGHEYIADNTDIPNIRIYLDSYNFRSGDEVSTEPMLMAKLSDENGINILGSPGHSIIMLLDDDNTTYNVTSGFSYDEGSATTGTLLWKLPKLTQGPHKVKIIAFDNFNRPAVAEMVFNCRSTEEISLSNVLVYPNPVKKDAYFSFINTEDADITINIFTITGRKIKTIRAPFLQKGYNQVFWDGKDEDGDRLANNTYFFKVKAKQKSNGKSVEITDKLIIKN